MNRVEVVPGSITLAPGESQEVTVTAIGAEGEAGVLFFPVSSRRGKHKGRLEVMTGGAVLFGPPENPAKLPVTIELIEETPTTATYRITAAELEELSRSERRKLKRS